MIAAVAMVKDEADIVSETVGRMAAVCDVVIVADNGSTDGTRELFEAMDVEVIDDPDPAYYQSAKMSRLAEMARERGAEWVIPFDADEVWFGKQGLRATLEGLPDEALVCEAVLFDHVATARDDPGLPPVERMVYRRRDPAPLRKVAIRARPGLTIHQGNHSASFEGVEHPLTVTGQLEVRHFANRSPSQMVRKIRNGAAAYAATDLPADIGAHWRQWGQLLDEGGEPAIEELFRRWFWRENPEDALEIEGEQQPPLVRDPCPLR